MGPLNIGAFGAVGDGVTDDWPAIQWAMDEARKGRVKEIVVPNGTFAVSRPVLFPQGARIVGMGQGGSKGAWSTHSWSRLRALPGFEGGAVLAYDKNGDDTWHWGSIQALAIIGNGRGGPNGIDPGVMGETSVIRDVFTTDCRDGIYLTGNQVTAHIENVSLNNGVNGINCDGVQSTVRVFGLSGDDNTHLLRVKGGVSAHVTVVGLKAENYEAGMGDPVVLIEDLDGGAVAITGAWCDTTESRESIVKIVATTTAQEPAVVLTNVGGNWKYRHLLLDAIGGASVPRGGGQNPYNPFVLHNAPIVRTGRV